MSKKRLEAGDTRSLEAIQKKYKSIVPEFEYNRTKGFNEKRKQCKTRDERRAIVHEVTYRHGTREWYDREIKEKTEKLDKKLAGEDNISTREAGLLYESLMEAQWGRDTLDVSVIASRGEKIRAIIKVALLLVMMLVIYLYRDNITGFISYIWSNLWKIILGLLIIVGLGIDDGEQDDSGMDYWYGYMDGKDSK